MLTHGIVGVALLRERVAATALQPERRELVQAWLGGGSKLLRMRLSRDAPSYYPTFFAGGGDQVPSMIEGGVSVGQ